MPDIRLTLPAARALHLAAQGMLAPRRRAATRHDVLEAIRRMGVLQIDTISVVARSPYLVLWSRLGAYDPAWLDEHLAEGRLFEYWAHEACFVPIEDYALFRHRMKDPAAMGWKYSADWMRERRAEVDALLAHIRANGPVKSTDFERQDGKGGGWWEWKPEKRSLEILFTAGELMIARRHNFQRVYDLASRVHPGWDERHAHSPPEARRHFTLRTVKALGVCREKWIADYYRVRGKGSGAASLAERGELLRVHVEGWDEPAYVHPDHETLARQAADGALAPTLTSILSPFDPIVWDRRRALELFNFDYRLECYTPAPKRKYGYFTLPVLRRGQLVGRIDAKAHRREGRFELKDVVLEPGTRTSERFAADIAGAVRRLATWHGCPDVQISKTTPAAFLAQLGDAISEK